MWSPSADGRGEMLRLKEGMMSAVSLARSRRFASALPSVSPARSRRFASALPSVTVTVLLAASLAIVAVGLAAAILLGGPAMTPARVPPAVDAPNIVFPPHAVLARIALPHAAATHGVGDPGGDPGQPPQPEGWAGVADAAPLVALLLAATGVATVALWAITVRSHRPPRTTPRTT